MDTSCLVTRTRQLLTSTRICTGPTHTPEPLSSTTTASDGRGRAPLALVARGSGYGVVPRAGPRTGCHLRDIRAREARRRRGKSTPRPAGGRPLAPVGRG